MLSTFILNEKLFSGSLSNKDYGKFRFFGLVLTKGALIEDHSGVVFQDDYEESIKLDSVSQSVFVSFFKNKNYFTNEMDFYSELIECVKDSGVVFYPLDQESIVSVKREIYRSNSSFL